MLLQQKVHKQPHPRRHCRAARKYGMNRFAVARVEGLQQGYKIAALYILGHAELADAGDAGAYAGELGECFAAAAFDIAADLERVLRRRG